MTAVGDLTWPELATVGRPSPVLVIPLGSTEQHGPHLPLSTDTDIAVGIASRLAAKRPATVVAPALPYGSSGEHQAFAGTMSIGPQATTTVIVELVRSAAVTFSHVVLVSTHGGNTESVTLATRRLNDEGRRVLAWSPSWPGDAHAGLTETSVMLALRPQLVRLSEARVGNVTPLVELLPALREERLAELSPNGVLGDPREATPALGRELLASAVEELVGCVDDWVRQA